jgi:hypothetical protein
LRVCIGGSVAVEQHMAAHGRFAKWRGETLFVAALVEIAHLSPQQEVADADDG